MFQRIFEEPNSSNKGIAYKIEIDKPEDPFDQITKLKRKTQGSSFEDGKYSKELTSTLMPQVFQALYDVNRFSITALEVIDGQIIAGTDLGHLVSLSSSSLIEKWRKDNYHLTWINSIKASHDSGYLASSADDKNINVMSWAIKEVIQKIKFDSFVYSLSWSKDSSFIAASLIHPSAIVTVDPLTGKEIVKVSGGFVGEVHSLVLFSGVKQIVAACKNNSLYRFQFY